MSKIVKVDFIKRKRKYPLDMYEKLKKKLMSKGIKIPNTLNYKETK